MKTILTILICNNFQNEISAPYEELELLYTDGGHDSADIIKNGIKQAKGKYIALADGTVEVKDFAAFSEAAQSSSSDILVFDGFYCFKASALKSLSSDDMKNAFRAEVCAALSQKTITYSTLKPFELHRDKLIYTDDNEALLRELLDEFNKNKAKVPKDVYAFARDLLCDKLTTFYLSAIYDIYCKKMSADKLTDFDNKLKQNIVLYLALGKSFTAANLQKLREKKFKINFIIANKFKKLLS